jgi:hypothetical protein
MESDWSPPSNQRPKQYKSNDWAIAGIGFALLIPLYGMGKAVLSTPLGIVTERATILIEGLQLSVIPTLLLILGLFLLWILASAVTTIGIHEFVHYRSAKILGGNPVYRWSNTLGLKNPSVADLRAGITRRDAFITMVAPLVILDGLLMIISLKTGGIVAATTAIMLLINTGAACGDIYHSFRIGRMPQGTLFANEIVDGELKTHISYPHQGEG